VAVVLVLLVDEVFARGQKHPGRNNAEKRKTEHTITTLLHRAESQRDQSQPGKPHRVEDVGMWNRRCFGPVVLMVSVEVAAAVVRATEAGLKAHVGAGVAVGVIVLQESVTVPVYPLIGVTDKTAVAVLPA